MSRKNSLVAYEGQATEHIRSMYLSRKERDLPREKSGTCCISKSVETTCGGDASAVAPEVAGGGDDDDDGNADGGEPDGRRQSNLAPRSLNPSAPRSLVAHQKPTRVLRMKGMPERCGLSRSALYQKIKEGSFPRGFALSARAVGWLESDVEDWILKQFGSR